jgi:hypothetical protein
MPRIVRELTVTAPIQSAWALVSDMERFSTCIPGCREVRRISEVEYDWVMEARVLRTTRKVTARTRAGEMRPPVHASFSGEGRLFERSNHYRLTLEGTTELEDLGAGRTRVRFQGDVRASDVGGAIVDKVAAGQLDELFGQFEDNVRRALGDDGSAPAPAPADAGAARPPPAPAPRRIPRWLVAAVAVVAAAAVVALALS